MAIYKVLTQYVLYYKNFALDKCLSQLTKCPQHANVYVRASF